MEPPPSRLAARVDRMLDDPSQLPSVAPAAAPAVAADASAASADATDGDATADASDDVQAAVDAAVAADVAAPAAADAVAQAADAKTAEAKPAEVKAAEAKPVEAKPTEAKPTEAKPAEPKPTEAKATKPTEAKPAEPKPTKPVEAKVEPTPEESATKPQGDATDLYYSGKRKLESGDLRGAVEDLKTSQAIRFSVRTLTMLGRAYFDLGEFGPAAKALQKAGDHDDAMLLLAQLYQQQGKNAQAKKVYERFLQIHGDHPKAAWVKRIVEAL